MTNEDIKPVKPGERTYIQRQFLRWNKYWQAAKIKENRDRYFEQAVKLGGILERELMEQYRGRRR